VLNLTSPITLFAALAVLSSGFASAAEGDRLLGTWLTPGALSRVEITKCGSRYCGVITWLKTPKADAKNPDPSLRGRPLPGAQILSGFAPDGTGGKVYSPERGSSYDAKLVLVEATTLEIRVSAGFIRKTVAWKRVE
jgi:uncharacterized protein (DUF2147 family)